MNRRVIDEVRTNMCVAQALNNTNVTTQYFKMGEAGAIAFHAMIATMAATKTAILKLVQATDAAGTDSKDVTGATVTLTSGTDIAAGTFTTGSLANTDVVTITAEIAGVETAIEYTKAAATDADAHEFINAAALVILINTDFAGVLLASGTTTITVTTLDGSSNLAIVKTEVAGTTVVATTKAQLTVDLKPESLDIDDGFVWVGANLAVTSNSVVGIDVQRCFNRQMRRIQGAWDAA